MGTSVSFRRLAALVQVRALQRESRKTVQQEHRYRADGVIIYGIRRSAEALGADAISKR